MPKLAFSEHDAEVKVIEVVVNWLESLPKEGQVRVVDYLVQRYKSGEEE